MHSNELQSQSFFELLRSIFPILLAVDGSNYLDLHDARDSYIVIYHNIVQFRFMNIIATFDKERLDQFKSQYEHGFSA